MKEKMMPMEEIRKNTPQGERIHYSASVEALKPDPELVQAALATLANLMMVTNSRASEFEIGNPVDGTFFFTGRRRDFGKKKEEDALEWLFSQKVFIRFGNDQSRPSANLKKFAGAQEFTIGGLIHEAGLYLNTAHAYAEYIERMAEPLQGVEFSEMKSARKVLEDHNRWRRGEDDVPVTQPKALGTALEIAIKALRWAERLEGKVE